MVSSVSNVTSVKMVQEEGAAFTHELAKAAKALTPEDRERLFGLSVTREGGRVIVDAGGGDDKVTVRQGADGSFIVKNEGSPLWVTIPPEGPDPVIGQNKGGNAYSIAPAATPPKVTVRAGDGDDVIQVDPSFEHDLVLEGGAGNDEITGGEGLDVISGGEGNDYIDGGGSVDRLEGGPGNDTYNSTWREDRSGNGDEIIDNEGFDRRLL